MLQLLFTHVEERLEAELARIVNEHVYTSEAFACRAYHRLARRALRGASRDSCNVFSVPKPLSRIPQPLTVAAIQNHVPAILEETLCHSESDATR